MAQLILKDSGILVDVGDEFNDYDEAHHQIVDTGQTFDEFRVPKRETWFYCPVTDWFYLSNRQQHGLIDAIKSQFQVPERWDDVLDVLEEHGIYELLNILNINKIRLKLQKAETNGQITAPERTSILSVLDHIEVTG